MNLGKHLSIFTILIMSLCGCEINNEITPNYYIDDGCIPSQIKLIEDLLGGYEDSYVYTNGILESVGSDVYTYKNGLVEKISISANRYEKYTYDNKKRIIGSEQFRRDKPNENFKTVSDIKYIYNGDIVIKATDNVQGEYYELFYQNNSKNIDSLKTFKLNGQLIEKEFFEYDNFNNIYKNLRTPKFGYFWNLKKHTTNNIKKQVLIKLEQPTDSIIFINNYKYDNFGFPTEIKNTWNKTSLTSVEFISYLNCK